MRTTRGARGIALLATLLSSGFFWVVPAPATAQETCPPEGTGYAGAKYTVGDDARIEPLLRAARLSNVVRAGGGVVTFEGSGEKARAALAGAGIAAPIHASVPRRWFAKPTDPAYNQQWYLRAVGAEPAWDRTTGSSSVIVADVDSGVDATHRDLAGKLVSGWDATVGRALGAGNSDEGGHGTSVAGVIGAVTNEGAGVASLGWNTPVMPIKAGDALGPFSAAVAAGVRYAADHGAKVINLSLGSPCREEGEAQAIAYAQEKGVLVVAAAGNEGDRGNPVEYPAALPNVLAVSATAPGGARASYSNFGSYVDIAAPGGAGNGQADSDLVLLASGGGTTTGPGTSFASPLVAAAAALVLASEPSLTPEAAGQRLIATATDLGPTGRDDDYGAGLLDVSAAVGGPKTGVVVNPPRATANVSRYAGTDRLETAIAISRASFPSQSNAAVLARADVFADALAGAPLARAKGAPILLTQSDALDDRVALELQRLLPAGGTVYLLGGTAALNGVVAQSVQNRGYAVMRIGGVDRFDTAALINERELPTTKTIWLADGTIFQDAMVAAAAAAQFDGAVILTGAGSMPRRSRAYIDARPQQLRIAVGPGAAVADEFAEWVVGSTPAGTAQALLEAHGGATRAVGVASVDRFADGLAAGPLIAATDGFLLLTSSSSLAPETAAALANHRRAIATVHIYGGTAAISEQVRSQIEGILAS